MNIRSTVNFNKKIWFWMIFAVAVFIRILYFGELPGGVNQDEAMGAVDAQALALYGTDRFGVRFPVHFAAWQVSQMSVLLSYLMIPFLKIFGFHTWVIRLPMLFSSIGGIVLVYLIGKKIESERLGLIVMALTAVNPWHFMQSRWSLDCNLFPHVFLLAFYLLLLSFEKRKYLYLSMVFFGLTFYCYGIAVYSVTPFLIVFALWGWRKKLFSFKEILLCICIFGFVALPEILVMAINLFHWDSIETGLITMSRFPESVRGNDILFLNFSFSQLGKNIWHMVKCCFLQLPDYWFNAIPAFGPMYHISIPLMVMGGFVLVRSWFRETAVRKKAEKLALLGFLLTGIWVGIITFEVNVNRINIIFYPLLFLCAYGICRIADKNRKVLAAVGGLYILCALLFLGTYFMVYPQKAARYYNKEFLEAVETADKEGSGKIYISGNMGWQYNLSMAEILTQYACHIDAKYYQGESVISNGRELLPYHERYSYINVQQFDWAASRSSAVWLVHEDDLGFIGADYEVIRQIGQFFILKIEWQIVD
ncbi:MAG: glycosyltransferase family 39 protein [Bacteroidales bacterium]|nr:glycosyltransferase family 39 protein [Lachnoclostridium sp.]MCM1382924.1 glycosyltransferase family 39 protein [Lachnoclostridium sp.]MCM1465930.1 glycosyltransferase family 39 protein [Bacteroidales bacterium]